MDSPTPAHSDDPEADVTPTPVTSDTAVVADPVVVAPERGGAPGLLASIGVLLAGAGIFLIGLGCFWHAVDDNHGEGRRVMRGGPAMGMRGGPPPFGMGMRGKGGFGLQRGYNQGHEMGQSTGGSNEIAPTTGSGAATPVPAAPVTPAKPAGK